jgi:hypothetical protein
MPERPSAPHGRERRRHPRLRIENLPLSLDGGGALRVRDLSRSGVCVFSDQPMRMMTHVRFHFRLPRKADAEVAGTGVVVRCERLSPALGHYEIAIFFQDFESGSEPLLLGYLAELAQGAS